MTRDELDKMIDDEVEAALSQVNTIREPEAANPVPKKPQPTSAKLNDDELDEMIFYGGDKPEK